ncbi:MAG: polyprenyl synthetase family protein [Veillonellaceae bacterium]|nr:polyprenyl synthetase family protein [Veillonellaceae bacterium]MDD6922828.1 polyprenyl synthetase family protein [Veillonellaceae bacterium]
MNMTIGDETWKKRIKLLDKALYDELHANGEYDKTLYDAMEYSLMAGGKRLRPMLLMAAADAVGGCGDDYIQAACAMEMIHTYSLIHDDLPAMDNDDLRRGKPTNHKVYGAGMATLAGDGLLTLAFEVLFRQKEVPAETLLTVSKEIAEAAGPAGMVGGQALDLESEHKKIDIDTLRKMHTGKTGALFRAAIRSGAILAGARKSELECLTIYAEKFGLAFQITDDILDVAGEQDKIGKPVGSDIKNDKSTYVTLLSLEEAGRLAAQTVADALSALSGMGDGADFLRSIVQYLVSRDH